MKIETIWCRLCRVYHERAPAKYRDPKQGKRKLTRRAFDRLLRALR